MMADILPTVAVADIPLKATMADVLLMVAVVNIPLVAAVEDISQPTAGWADFPFCVIPSRHRVPTSDFGHVSSQLILIAQEVSMYTNCREH
jgi:hypothetical protein